ncbi:MAG TPA: DUF4389 domain-containing protein [Vicinamibacterales bacterium]|nr:DUF4389 domain-containing protein [Vicinamibacterales bacterium]
MAYAVSATFEPQLTNRNRMTTGFRIILAIPHLLLVGAIGASVAVSRSSNSGATTSLGGEAGVLGTLAFLLAIISWFTIVISGEHYNAIRRYSRFYLRWRVRALSYLMLLQDQYPPFGDAPYPAALTFEEPPAGPRDRVSVGFRIILAIPHFILLFFISCAWWVTTVFAWFAILITGRYPEGLYEFGAGTLRWLIRVEAYMLLMIDDYPPFSFS